MRTFIIDGFNLIHKIPFLKDSNSPHLDLLRYIRREGIIGSHNNRAIIVFDGYENESVRGEKGFDIYFGKSRSADEVIKELVDRCRKKQNVIVVSDDIEIREYVRGGSIKIWSNSEFIKRGRSSKRKNHTGTNEKVSCSEAIEINEELKKIWLTDEK